jgi:hypothetical protein
VEIPCRGPLHISPDIYFYGLFSMGCVKYHIDIPHLPSDLGDPKHRIVDAISSAEQEAFPQVSDLTELLMELAL